MILTAHADDASWVCQLNGEAKPDGDNLEIGDSVFRVHLRDAATLVVPDNESTHGAARDSSGLNGTSSPRPMMLTMRVNGCALAGAEVPIDCIDG